MNRRGFIRLIAGAAAAWPLAARPQQPLPVIALVNATSADAGAIYAAAFRKALAETGYVEGQNMTVEPYWLEGQLEDKYLAVMRDLVRRRVAVIATVIAGRAAIAAKAATSTIPIPIVFSVGQDPVKYGLVASLARPGGNATGTNYFNTEISAKRLGLLHELVPKARRIAVLLNPLVQGTNAPDALADFQEAARTLGLEIVHVLRANTTQQIDAAFATLERERPDALWVTGSGFFASHSAQIVNLTARSRIPASYGSRDIVVAGGLMSYAAKVEDSIRQVGVYAGRILKGAKPADLPVVQATTFEFVINLQTARTLGIDIPPGVFAIADELIQ